MGTPEHSKNRTGMPSEKAAETSVPCSVNSKERSLGDMRSGCCGVMLMHHRLCSVRAVVGETDEAEVVYLRDAPNKIGYLKLRWQ